LNVLFIGNGLNRCLTNAVSWDAILKELVRKLDIPGVAQDEATLEFERILNEALILDENRNADIYKSVKMDIARQLQMYKLPENSLHHKYISLPMDCFLTTNYDYTLEAAIDCSLNYRHIKSGSSEKKFSLYRKQKIKDQCIYHIHGESKAPASICLGFEHYVGILGKLKSVLFEHQKGLKDFTLLNVIRREIEPTGCYAEFFFTHNIFIVGWALDKTEIDVWWILVYRAFLMNTNYKGINKWLDNKIYFYCFQDSGGCNNKMNSMLHSLNVEMVEIPVRHMDYVSAYDSIFEDISSRI